MKNIFKRLIILFFSSILYCNVNAKSIQIATTQSLSFGSFVAGSGGNVIMSPTGTRTNTGTVTLLLSDPGYPAQFMVTSIPINQNYSVTFSSSVQLSGPGTSMRLSQFKSSPASRNTGASGQILSVGGTLTVGSSQASGSYSGFFLVTVNLN